ncbi:anti-sigma factor family protein [Gemmatimonadota bacterium]
MKHIEIYIDEYLKGELSRSEAERVAAHLAECEQCRKHETWLKGLGVIADTARIEPPAAVTAELQTRLAAIPERIDRDEIEVPRVATRTTPLFTTPAWLAYPAPLLKTAALLLLGILAGYAIRGDSAGQDPVTGSPMLTEAMGSGTPPAAVPGAEITQVTMSSSTTEALEARITELERALMITYLARVEATMTHFVTGTSEGNVADLPAGTTSSLLTKTANLKTDAKAVGDTRMVNLFGQIEMVLTEIEKVLTAEDLGTARFIAGIIEEEGLLNTLQRIKVGLEE